MSSYRGNNNQLDFGTVPKQKSSYPSKKSTKPSFLQSDNETFNGYLNKFDHFTDNFDFLYDSALFTKIRPYTPVIARFLIVATFFEDTMRISSQWADQVFYLWHYRHIPYYLAYLFLLIISLTMLVASVMMILKKKVSYAAIALIATVGLQAIVYGSSSGFSFVLRNISVVGGLLIAIGDSIVTNKSIFGMLPELTNKKEERKNIILLTGRILIVLMFLTFTVQKNFLTVALVLFGTLLIAIGYKTKFASALLMAILFIYNISVNNYWFYKRGKRDMMKYEFFQNLSIMGGLLLAVNTGAGQHSLDEKKKIY